LAKNGISTNDIARLTNTPIEDVYTILANNWYPFKAKQQSNGRCLPVVACKFDRYRLCFERDSFNGSLI